MKKLVVFDWDDVFTTGSMSAYHACYLKAAKDAGSKAEEGDIFGTVDTMWGLPHEIVIKNFLVGEESLIDRVITNYENNILSNVFLDQLCVVEGSLQMLRRLSHTYKLSLVSGINPHLLKDIIFPKYAVPKVFSSIITSYDLEDRSKGKPNPDMLNIVLNNHSISPSEAVYVGDAPGDVIMAQSAGVDPIVVLTGQLNRASAEKMGVTYIVEKVTDVEALLRCI